MGQTQGRNDRGCQKINADQQRNTGLDVSCAGRPEMERTSNYCICSSSHRKWKSWRFEKWRFV